MKPLSLACICEELRSGKILREHYYLGEKVRTKKEITSPIVKIILIISKIVSSIGGPKISKADTIPD